MDDYAQEYVEFLESLPDKDVIFIETPVNMEAYAPECYGTADFITVYGDTLHIVDFKYGRGVKVSAQENPQLMLYALGAYEYVKAFMDVTNVKMSIFQPRIKNIDTAEMAIDSLIQWAGAIKPAALEAYQGGKNLTCGDWCKFCKIKHTCRTHADTIINATQRIRDKHHDPFTISPEELCGYYNISQDLVGYANSLKEYIQKLMLSGTPVPGLKLVEGRSRRVWTDEEQALFVLQEAGYDTHYTQPYSLSQLEKQIGAKKFSDMVGALVVKSPGNPTIADADDARKEYKPYADDFNDIEPAQAPAAESTSNTTATEQEGEINNEQPEQQS